MKALQWPRRRGEEREESWHGMRHRMPFSSACSVLWYIMVAVKLWWGGLKGRRFKINCDNSTALLAMGHSRVKNLRIQDIMREMAFWCARGQCELQTVHNKRRRKCIPICLVALAPGPKVCRPVRSIETAPLEGGGCSAVPAGIFQLVGIKPS